MAESQVKPLAREAARRWSLAGADPRELRTLLSTIDVRIADLPGSRLGAAGRGRLLLDIDAAGYGWFIDSTPANDREFQKIISRSERQATVNSESAGRVDLLTVVTHEFGHLLGLPDLPAAVFPHHVMNETIGLGTRRSPDLLSPRPHAHIPSQQSPHFFLDTLHGQRSAARDSAGTRPTFNALDKALADEDSEWHVAVDALFAKENALDRVLQDWGA